MNRANTAERDAVADRQAVGGAEPTRFRPAGSPARESASNPPTPLRSRIERTTRAGPTAPVAPPPASPAQEARAKASSSGRPSFVEDPADRRLGGVPIRALAGLVVVLAVLTAIGYMVLPWMGDLFAGDSDTAALPNTSAVVAGTPVAQVTGQRARATAVAEANAARAAAATASDAATSDSAPGAASATSSAAAATVPALAPEPADAAPAQLAAAAAAAQPAGTTLLDERFTSNDRKWPSSSQGTAFVSNGSYRLTPRQAGQFVAVGAPIADVLQDVIVNATFHKLNGPSGGGYGIIVRDQSPAPQTGASQAGQYYVLEVGDKGEVGMWRRDGDHWVDLMPWQPNAAVRPDTGSNDLSVRAVGNGLTLSVNGTQVATTTDDRFASGGVGLFVGGDGNQVSVDRFSIQTP